MKILTDTTSSDENWNGDCDYAIIEINKTQAEHFLGLIAKAQELKETLDHFYQFKCFDYSVTYLESSDELDETLVDVDGKDAWDTFNADSKENVVILSDDFDWEVEAEQRTECDTICVQEDSVRWDCFVKHTNCRIKTKQLNKELIEKIAKEEA